MNPGDQFLSTTQVAKRCGVAAKTVGRWVDAGILAAVFTSGGHRRIKVSDLELFLANRRSLKALNSLHAECRIVLLTKKNELKAISTSVARGKNAEVRIVETLFEAGVAVSEFCPHLLVVDTSISRESTASIVATCRESSNHSAVQLLLVGDTELSEADENVVVIQRMEHGTFSQILDNLTTD